MADDFKPGKPTHRMKVISNTTKATATVGAAWQRPDGSFLLRLDPCTVIDWRDDVTISLFPVDT